MFSPQQLEKKMDKERLELPLVKSAILTMMRRFEQYAWKRKRILRSHHGSPPPCPPTTSHHPYCHLVVCKPHLEVCDCRTILPRCAHLLSGFCGSASVVACFCRVSERRLILFIQLIFMCITSLLYTGVLYNTCSFMFKRILKVRKIFCIFDFKRHVISTF